MRAFISLLFILGSSIAWSQALTTEKADTFIDSLDPVTQYAQNLDEEVQEGLVASDLIPQQGEPLRPYSRSLEFIREEHPNVYDDMGEIVSEHGFSSMEEWAETGDRVIVAWMALQMEGTDLGPVTPEMLNQVPEQMRPQIERMLAMMEAVRNAPPEDVEVMRPLAGKLQDYMNAQGGQAF